MNKGKMELINLEVIDAVFNSICGGILEKKARDTATAYKIKNGDCVCMVAVNENIKVCISINTADGPQKQEYYYFKYATDSDLVTDIENYKTITGKTFKWIMEDATEESFVPEEFLETHQYSERDKLKEWMDKRTSDELVRS